MIKSTWYNFISHFFRSLRDLLIKFPLCPFSILSFHCRLHVDQVFFLFFILSIHSRISSFVISVHSIMHTNVIEQKISHLLDLGNRTNLWTNLIRFSPAYYSDVTEEPVNLLCRCWINSSFIPQDVSHDVGSSLTNRQFLVKLKKKWINRVVEVSKSL